MTGSSPSATNPAPASVDAHSGRVVISVDCMGGDQGPEAVVASLVLCARDFPDADFLAHGDEAQLTPLLANAPSLQGRVTLVHAARVVTMEDKPAQVMRHGNGTSMWSAIDSVRDRKAQAAVSCGNTGALMAVSMLRLRKLTGVDRPAIAVFWPSRNPSGMNVMLDGGAEISADVGDYLQYAVMGASFARNALGLQRPRVGLLNMGTEDHKGAAILREAQTRLIANAAASDYDYVGFVEGTDLPSDRVDVIVTDGFTGNVALKTAEGTAKLVSDFVRETLTSTIWAKLGYLLARRAFQRLRRKMDPRRSNGGVFLGLNGTVVKSHGSADATGIAAAVALAIRLARAGFQERLAARVASAAAAGQDAAQSPDLGTDRSGQNTTGTGQPE